MSIGAVYPIPGMPTVWLKKDGSPVQIRTLTPQDGEALLAFFRRVPMEERHNLKEDVLSPIVIQRWTMNMDFGRVIPLIAEADGMIIADGTLHRRRAIARRHIGEIRIVVDPEYRNSGVGRGLVTKLIELARSAGLERLIFEVVTEREEAAQHTAHLLGFNVIAILPNHIKDIDGTYRDLAVLEMDLKATEEPKDPGLA